MPATTIAIAAAASANSAAINASIAAHKAECVGTLANFDSRTATIAEQKSYASCVNLMHPSQITDSGVMAIKICILIVFASAIFGGLRGWKEDGLIGGFMEAFIGACLAAACLLIFGLVIAGIGFLFV